MKGTTRRPRRPQKNARARPGAQLSPTQLIFAQEYLRNGFNARRAYLVAHPRVTLGTAASEGHETLNLPKVRAWLNTRLEAAWKVRQMGGEEALARIAQIANFDIRDLYDEQNRLLPVNQWPNAIVGVVRSVQDGPYGLKVSVESPHAALRTILEQSGKLRMPGDSVDALAEALLVDLKRHGHAVKE